MNYSLEGKDIVLQLYVDSTSVQEGDTIQVTLTASGNDAVPGLSIPYSIIGSVRSSDIKTQTMFGLFTLDSSLVAKLNIKINKEPYTESTTIPTPRTISNSLPITTIYPSLKIPSNTVDQVVYAEILTLGLYYKPSIYVDVDIQDINILEPDARITSFKDNKPYFEISPINTSVKEGSPALYIVKYKNVINGFKFNYSSYDPVTQLYFKDYFYTDDTGYAYLVVPTTITNTTARQVTITLDRYPEVNSTVQVNTAKIVGYDSPLFDGKKSVYPNTDYSVIIPYGRSLKFYIVGGGGAGADVLKSGGTDGGDGSASYIYNPSYGTFRATGGKGGLNNGMGGAGGKVEIIEPLDGSITYRMVDNFAGNTTDIYPDAETQPGGVSSADNANTSNNGAGGKGSKGTGTAQREVVKRRWYGSTKRYTETYQTVVYGRGGSSGAYLSVILTNNSSVDLTFTVVAGSGGINLANNDLNGTNGVVIIEDA